MSKYDAELRRRLESGASMQETTEWYIDCVIKENLEWKDLSPIEVRFMKEYKEGYDRWMKGPGRRH
jgi:hypothetical protein